MADLVTKRPCELRQTADADDPLRGAEFGFSGTPHDSAAAGEASAPQKASIEALPHYTPRDCPAIADDAKVTAHIAGAKSGAPNTVHPGVDLVVDQGGAQFVVRVHFGDRGDGKNSVMEFDGMNAKGRPMIELPQSYAVEPQRVRALFDYLKERDYTVGKFTGWGIPISPFPASGSNCGDAFREVAKRLGIDSQVYKDMDAWIKDHHLGKWAFDRGRRNPADDFYHGK
jgi:hypothetical protein